MFASTSKIVQKANRLVSLCGTRDPHKIAKEVGVEVLYYPFKLQRGAYKVIMRNRFMFVKEDLHPVMENIVLLHELGHDTLHRDEATRTGGFKEFNIFDIRIYLTIPLTVNLRFSPAAYLKCLFSPW